MQCLVMVPAATNTGAGAIGVNKCAGQSKVRKQSYGRFCQRLWRVLSSSSNRLTAAVFLAVSLLFATIFAALPSLAFADNFVGENIWQVVFTGSEMVENFNEEEYVDQIGHLQPGDSVKFQVRLESKADYDTNWYMTNKVVETLEEDVNNRTSAKDGFYSYRLTYVNPTGEETVLYDSDAIGSESKYLDEEGLHQATNALEDYFFLDMLKPSQVANVYLDITMDGETEGNEYQDTLAKLKMNFAVERAQNSTQTNPSNPTPNNSGGEITKSPTENTNPLYPSLVQLAQTGDFWLAIAVFLVALSVGLIVLILAIRRMSREGREQ